MLFGQMHIALGAAVACRLEAAHDGVDELLGDHERVIEARC
jgi:hypothetical protein